MHNIAIFASHNGSGFDAIYEAVVAKKLNLNIVLLISNNAKAIAVSKAKQYGIDTHIVNSQTHSDINHTIYTLLKTYNCTTVFLSGYMKKISPFLTQQFHIINSHPSLLPHFGGAGMYGRFVHEAVIANKETCSGVTIHEVNEVYDAGKILLQKKILLTKDETVKTLEQKIKQLEKIAIVEALQNV